MILVHRLRGEPMYVNPDLVESVAATPDTVLVLIDGRRLFVEESPEVVVERVTAFRASLLVAADDLRAAPPLTVVPPPAPSGEPVDITPVPHGVEPGPAGEEA